MAPEKQHLEKNPSQQEAICHFEGPCEVIAGPGSGKTFVLVERILFLILERNVPPSEILVLTFSRAAAREMQERFLLRVREISSGPPPRQNRIPFSEVTFGTFHSVFYSILTASSVSRQTILDSSHSRRLLTALFERCYQRPLQGEELTDLSSLIARAKTTGTLPESATFRTLFESYEAYLRENSLLDFDDMVLRCLQLLSENQEILKRWQERFRFLLVDEFQDINREQFEAVRLLAGASANLFAVGDDDQSIYRFRGSDVAYMLRFSEFYPGSRIIRLSVNYRSLPPIVRCAGRIIEENTVRLPKKISAARTLPSSAKPPFSAASACMENARDLFRQTGAALWTDEVTSLHDFETEKAQYRWLCQTLQSMPEKEQGNSAVIVRSHTQMKGLLSAMDQAGIRYRLSGFSDRKRSAESPELVRKAESFLAIVRAYYRLSFGLEQDRLLRRDLFYVINHPERFLLRSSFSMESCTVSDFHRIFPEHSKEKQLLDELLRDLQMLRKLSVPRSVRWILQILREDPLQKEPALAKGLTAVAEKCTSQRQLLSSLEDLTGEKLLSAAKESQRSRDGRDKEETGGEQPAGVFVLTMHASKGLEFDTVFLPDLNEGIFPGRRAKSQEAIEEERRLFYVAVTRARNRLFLLWLSGSRQNPRTPSRFLSPLGVRPDGSS